MRKNLFWAIPLMLLLGYGNIFAHDCHLIASEALSSPGYLQTNPLINTLKNHAVISAFPQENIQRAFVNMKGYCCRDMQGSKQNDGQSILSINYCSEDRLLRGAKDNFAFSAMLYDHFLDIYLRALEGDEQNIYGDALLDEKGKEWRILINEFADSAGGVFPQTIQAKYSEFRGFQSKYKLWEYNGQSASDYLALIDSQEEETNILSSYSDRSLYTRYQNVCPIVTYMTFKMAGDNFAPRDAVTLFDYCQNKMIPLLLHQEKDYIVATIVNKSNTLLDDGMKTQVQYFYELRAQEFIKKLQDIGIYLSQIYRLVDRITTSTS